MTHCRHRHRATAERLEHLADALGIVARSVHDILAFHFSLGRLEYPFIALAGYADDGSEPHNRCSEVPRAFRQSLGQLRRVNVAIVRVVQSAFDVMGFDERVLVLDFIAIDDLDVHPLIPAHSASTLEFLHALVRMRQSD